MLCDVIVDQRLDLRETMLLDDYANSINCLQWWTIVNVSSYHVNVLSNWREGTGDRTWTPSCTGGTGPMATLVHCYGGQSYSRTLQWLRCYLLHSANNLFEGV